MDQRQVHTLHDPEAHTQWLNIMSLLDMPAGMSLSACFALLKAFKAFEGLQDRTQP